MKLRKHIGHVIRGTIGIFENNRPQKIVSRDVKRFEIGKSIGGLPIECFQIGHGGRKIILAAGIHGNEVGTVKLAQHLTHWLHANTDEFEMMTVFVVLCLNPDGFSMAKKNPDYFHGGRIGRFNKNNVDLNRNFLTKSFRQNSLWMFGKNYSETVPVYCGPHGNSEPETKALTDFILSNGIKMLVMFHNAGREVMGSNDPLAQNLAGLYAQKTGFKLVNGKMWPTNKQTGTAKDWCEENSVSYIEIEGSVRWGSDWKTQKGALIAVLEEFKMLRSDIN
ncbi:DUF2817 domain-containing protein [Candidatus Peregrinibacteria bacterium]|nr:DUF2817 domain-containing protein [Candidatus Peregrinibacteria bacterium]